MKAVMPVFFLKSMTFTVSQQILSGAPFSTEAHVRPKYDKSKPAESERSSP